MYITIFAADLVVQGVSMQKATRRILGAAAIALIGSTLPFATAALAQRALTPQERAQMQKELDWQKQQKLKADQNARTSYTEKCSMVGGALKCSGAPAGNPQTPKTGIGTAWTGNAGSGKPRGSVVPDQSPKLGTAYGNQQGSLPLQGGYTTQTYINTNKPRNNGTVPTNSGGNFGTKYISQ